LKNIAFLAAALAVMPAAPVAAQSVPANVQLTVCFTPPESCGAAIIERIQQAKREIRVQAYGFTHKGILAALAAAKRRGVDVAVILDKTNDRAAAGRSSYGGATYMAHAGVPVWVDDQVAIAHNKVMIIDRRLVVGGSFNYTAAADTKNAENVTFTFSAEAANLFLANWQRRREASRHFVSP
jgi:phosphatidylserine/phosphatidylglycerophosphate/cardiolipin synthase-like enzyme